jgi:lactase-phlorizin hydrolase
MYPDRVASVNGSDPNGDVACDSFHKWHKDFEMLKELGVTAYRFSFSWSRILPQGTPEKPSQDGIQYYRRILKELKYAGIQPEVTLYHWDLPQTLQDRGNGWLNPNSVEWFGDYANFCFKTFGNLVKIWLTHNEPLETAWDSYGHWNMAPGMGDIPSRYPYQVMHCMCSIL